MTADPPVYTIPIVPAVQRQGLSDAKEKLVCLVAQMTRDGHECTARAPWFARRLGWSERSTYRRIAELIEDGWLAREGRRLELARPVQPDRPPVSARGTTLRARVSPAKMAGPAAKMAETPAILAESGAASKDLVRDSSGGIVVDPPRGEAKLPAPAAAVSLLPPESGKKGGEGSSLPANDPGTASLPGQIPPSDASAYVETPEAQECHDTALELSTEEEETRAAATELNDRGLDGTAPLKWAREKGLARVLEVCRWADRQKWRSDPARCPREITCALRDGYGTAPLPGSEAEAGLKQDHPTARISPWEELPAADDAYRRYLRGQETEEERARNVAERAMMDALKRKLCPERYGGAS